MYSLSPYREANYRGHGTVGRGDGQIQPSTSYDPHHLVGEQTIIQDNCGLSINPFVPNPFIVQDQPNTWNDNYLVMRDPRLRTLSGVAPLDRGFAHSSKYVSNLHQYPCYTDYKLRYRFNDVHAPKAGHPHS